MPTPLQDVTSHPSQPIRDERFFPTRAPNKDNSTLFQELIPLIPLREVINKQKKWPLSGVRGGGGGQTQFSLNGRSINLIILRNITFSNDLFKC